MHTHRGPFIKGLEVLSVSSFDVTLNGLLEMRGLVLVILILTAALWAVDLLALESRYSAAIWRVAQSKGRLVNYEVQRWLARLEPSRR
jgi:ABC-type xylose transport system permease subunit